MKIPSLHTLRRIFFARVRKPLGMTSQFRLEPPALSTKGNVLVGHGWSEHMLSPTFLPLPISLFFAGYNVSGFDLPNHGAHVNEHDRGIIKSYQKFVSIFRAVIFRVLFSRARGHRRTVLVVYSTSALLAKRLLEQHPLLRQGIWGVIFVSSPLEVTQNASERVQNFIPKIMPYRNVLKHLVPHFPVSGPREPSPDDPYHSDRKVPLCTAVEIFNAASDATAAGALELIADVPCVAFIHGKNDKVATWEHARKAFLRIAGEDSSALLTKNEHGVERIQNANGTRVAIAYPGIGHDIFAESDRIIPDIIEILDGWMKVGKFTPVFFDEKSLDYDLVDFTLWSLEELFRRLRGNWRGIVEYIRAKYRRL